ncbi:MAG: CHAD domain-containing protein [Solirubrobacterales bacterium]|nr:CHAD domain-containing protein [Solirubrobacterales bacterium]
MAKAREIPGLSTDLAYGEVAARVLEVRCRELMDHSANVLDVTHIEGVHDMRVASRRLRAAIEVFWPCFPKKGAKAVLSEVKGLADALGERRDRDVAIAMLGSFAAAMPHPDRRGIASLIEEFEAEQLAANDELEGPVEPARLERLEAAVLELAAAARDAAGGSSPAGGSSNGSAPQQPAGEGEPR